MPSNDYKTTLNLIKTAAEKDDFSTLVDLDVNIKDKNGFTLLINIINAENIKAIKWLLKHPKIDLSLADTFTGHTAFRTAVENGNIKIAKMLLDTHQIDLNHRAFDGSTALMVASNPEILDLLYSENAPGIDAIDDKGNTALIHAAEIGYLNTVKYHLAKQGEASLAVKNKEGCTAFMLAIKKCQLKTVQYFIEQQGTAVLWDKMRDYHDNTLLILALSEKMTKLHKPQQTTLIKLLLQDSEVDINETNNEGNTAIMLAIKNSNLEALQHLLSSQKEAINWSQTNREDKTALILAVEENQLEMVKLILAQGEARIHKKDKEGYSILRRANSGAMLSLLTEKLGDSFEIHQKQDRITAHLKKLAHNLGYSRAPPLLSMEGIKLLIRPTGNTTFRSLVNLTERFEKYKTLHPSKTNNLIFEAIKANRDFYSGPQKQTVHSLLQNYKDNKMVMISSGWEKHTIGLVLYKDILIISNRGEGRHDAGGVLIYNIDPTKVNEEYIQNVKNTGTGDRDTSLSAIKAILLPPPPHDEPPIKIFDTSKAQKHGTCSFVNPKSAIEAMLYLLKIEEFCDQKEANKIELASLPDIVVKAATQYCHDRYKHFTQEMRDYSLEELIATIKNKGIAANEKEMYIGFAIGLLSKGLNSEATIRRLTKLTRALETEISLLNDKQKDMHYRISFELAAHSGNRKGMRDLLQKNHVQPSWLISILIGLPENRKQSYLDCIENKLPDLTKTSTDFKTILETLPEDRKRAYLDSTEGKLREITGMCLNFRTIVEVLPKNRKQAYLDNTESLLVGLTKTGFHFKTIIEALPDDRKQAYLDNTESKLLEFTITASAFNHILTALPKNKKQWYLDNAESKLPTITESYSDVINILESLPEERKNNYFYSVESKIAEIIKNYDYSQFVFLEIFKYLPDKVRQPYSGKLLPQILTPSNFQDCLDLLDNFKDTFLDTVSLLLKQGHLPTLIQDRGITEIIVAHDKKKSGQLAGTQYEGKMFQAAPVKGVPSETEIIILNHDPTVNKRGSI